VGYSSILLLGQKVSRLGLSTHKEKVSVIMDLATPRHVLDLQKFLGMCGSLHPVLRVHRRPLVQNPQKRSEV
jgi:hypothetical protein